MGFEKFGISEFWKVLKYLLMSLIGNKIETLAN